MAAARCDRSGSFLAAVLGMTALAARAPALAQAPTVQRGNEAPAQEVVILGTRQSDALLTAKVEQALQDDPYVFAAHISVVTEHGVVRLEGIALDVTDMYRALDLARRIAGKRRVVNEIELRNALWD
jgi:osmotically-inducible protein OsmY